MSVKGWCNSLEKNQPAHFFNYIQGKFYPVASKDVGHIHLLKMCFHLSSSTCSLWIQFRKMGTRKTVSAIMAQNDLSSLVTGSALHPKK